MNKFQVFLLLDLFISLKWPGSKHVDKFELNKTPLLLYLINIFYYTILIYLYCICFNEL